jgi:hypothetical protein
VLLVASLREISLVDRIAANPAAVAQHDVDSADRLFGATAFLLLLAGLLTVAVFAGWLYRARRNVEEWAPVFQRHAPGWAVGGWFCPVVNLWFPYQLVRDTWDDTIRGDAEVRRAPRRLVLVWWATVLMHVPQYLVAYSAGGASDRSRGDYATTVALAVISIAGLLLAILVVQGLSTAQERRRARAYTALRARTSGT